MITDTPQNRTIMRQILDAHREPRKTERRRFDDRYDTSRLTTMADVGLWEALYDQGDDLMDDV